MDVESTKTAVWEALKSPSVSIIGLVGRWGVGKTHLWKTVVEERRRELALEWPRYGYVSLFGLRDISDVKTSILLELAQTGKPKADASAAEAGWLAEARERKTALLRRIQKGAAGLGMLGRAAAEAIQLGIDAFEFHAVRNALVCLDDLERMAPPLNAIEIMGLIESLAREKACKFVLIFSRDDLADESKKSLDIYREKIFDREILFDPPTSYGVRIVTKGREGPEGEALSKSADTLSLKNVRVLRKIIAGYDDILGHLPEVLEPVRNALMFSLGVLYYCHLVRGETVPTVDEVLAIEFVSPIEEGDVDENSATTKHLQFLRRAGWTHLSDSDRFLAKYVKDGVCDWSGLSDLMQEENQQVGSSLRCAEIDTLWKEYRASFLDTPGWDAFAHRVQQKYLEHLDVVSTHRLDGALWLLRKVGMGEEADQLLESWRAAHTHQKHMFDLSALETTQKLNDAGLRRVCEQEYQPSDEKKKDILEILARISSDKSWGGDDNAFLEAARTEDYASAFRSRELSPAALDGAKLFLRLGNPEPADIVIREKIQAALREIAQDSEINRDKVRALGVSLADQNS